MGINLGNMSSKSNNIGGGITLPTPTPVDDSQKVSDGEGGLTLNLEKNQLLNLTKRNPGLKVIRAGIGWDVSYSGSDDFDLDVIALLLDKNNKLTDVSKVCYFNNDNTHGFSLSGDNKNGEGEGDDETISVDLASVPKDIEKVVFAVVIYEGKERKQNFGMVDNSYIRLLNGSANDKELCRFVLSEDSSLNTAVIFAEVYRNGSEWDFRTIGEGKNADINGVIKLYC